MHRLSLLDFGGMVSLMLNGFSFPTSMPSMPRLFPDRKERGKRRKNKREMLEEDSSKSRGGIDKFIAMDDPEEVNNRRLLHEEVGDMNNIQNIWDNVNMNLDQDIEEKDLFAEKEQ